MEKLLTSEVKHFYHMHSCNKNKAKNQNIIIFISHSNPTVGKYYKHNENN